MAKTRICEDCGAKFKLNIWNMYCRRCKNCFEDAELNKEYDQIINTIYERDLFEAVHYGIFYSDYYSQNYWEI